MIPKRDGERIGVKLDNGKLLSLKPANLEVAAARRSNFTAPLPAHWSIPQVQRSSSRTGSKNPRSVLCGGLKSGGARTRSGRRLRPRARRCTGRKRRRAKQKHDAELERLAEQKRSQRRRGPGSPRGARSAASVVFAQESG